MASSLSIDNFVEKVTKGYAVKTGVDVLSSNGVLLLEKDVLVKSINTVLILKQNGLSEVPIDYDNNGGIWDRNGNLLQMYDRSHVPQEPKKDLSISDIEDGIEKRKQQLMEAEALHKTARKTIKTVIDEIKKTGGKFEQQIVEATIDEIFVYLSRNTNAYTSLTRDIFSYDDYLYNHAVNVCIYGIATLHRFNDIIGSLINRHLNNVAFQDTVFDVSDNAVSYIHYYPEELREIAIGYFLHDIGMVLVPDNLLNNKGTLTAKEFDTIKGHSYKLGLELLDKNKIVDSTIRNVVLYHHGPFFNDEERTYPTSKLPIEIPPYVKICKLADMYDAMTSKRSYKDAFNPVSVVTEVFRKYAKIEDAVLKIVLQSFINVVGVYPSGSCVYLLNGQIAFVLDSEGPVIIPFTDEAGNILSEKQDPVELTYLKEKETSLRIDRRKPPLSPTEAHTILPSYLKEIVSIFNQN